MGQEPPAWEGGPTHGPGWAVAPEAAEPLEAALLIQLAPVMTQRGRGRGEGALSSGP